MITYKYLLEYQQIEKNPFGTPDIKDDRIYFNSENEAVAFILNLEENEDWELNWYCFNKQVVFSKNNT